MTSKADFMIARWRYNPTAHHAREAFVACHQEGRKVPKYIESAVLAELKKQIADYGATPESTDWARTPIGNSRDQKLRKIFLMRGMKIRKGKRTEYFKEVAKKWGVETDSVRRLYYKLKKENWLNNEGWDPDGYSRK